MRLRPVVLLFVLAACSSAPKNASGPVLTGLDVLVESGFAELRGKKVGLITNHTGKDRRGRGIVELFGKAEGVELVALFSPEHGFTGVSEEFRISSMSVIVGGRTIPVHSLYGGGITTMRPKREDLLALDALVFDIQDIGVRFYTYLATMAMALEESAKAGVPFYVLDRPNPINGVDVEGPVLAHLDLRLLTPTAYLKTAIRHGLTAGEAALLHNDEVRHPSLRVIELRNWKRSMWYDQTGLPWTPPSPNMPDLEAAALYPGIGLFEAANVSVGRGTPIPFRWIGAPWMDGDKVAALMNSALLDGVTFAAESYAPSKSVYAGQACEGVRITVTDRAVLKPTAVFLAFVDALKRAHPDDFKFKWSEARKMTGTDEFQRLYERGGDLKALFETGAAGFEKSRRPFLLY